MNNNIIANVGRGHGLMMYAPPELIETFFRRALWFNKGHASSKTGETWADETGRPSPGRCSEAEAKWFRAGYWAAEAGFQPIYLFSTDQYPFIAGYQEPKPKPMDTTK